MKNAMVAVTALSAALVSGIATADVVSPELEQLGDGIAFDTTSHYENKEIVVVDAPNLMSGMIDMNGPEAL